MSTRLSQITLIGVGLIGGSFALDLKKQHRVGKVIGIDINADNLSRALERRVIDEAAQTIDDTSVGNADLVLIATPVSTLSDICCQLEPILADHTIISDVGSTKQSALTAFAQHLPKQLPRCVASHPIAGSDRSGATAARFGLYEGKKLILCPHPMQDESSLKTIEALWQAVGAQTHRMSAAEHDAVFAAVSHLPHLLAFAYMQQIAQADKSTEYLKFAGSGFRDFTRIAASHPKMWTDIMLENREPLLALLQHQQHQLAYLAECLHQHNSDQLYAYFEGASRAREQWGNEQ